VSPAHSRFSAQEGCFHLTFEQDKSFLEVMSMRWRSATRGNVHINDAEAPIGLLAGHRDGVSIADRTDVREVVGLRQREIAFWAVRWNRWQSSGRFVSPLECPSYCDSFETTRAFGLSSRLITILKYKAVWRRSDYPITRLDLC
jgi:hypothetical protein